MVIDQIQAYFDRHLDTISLVRDRLAGKIAKSADIIAVALKRGNKVLIMGNGGSAADSQHFAAELVGRFLIERKGLPAIALTTDTSVLTAVSNDYGFDQVFKRQVQALAVPSDVVIGISTSGHSQNVFNALTAAKETGCTTLALLGKDGGSIANIVDLDLTVPADDTPFVQEAHSTILHLVCLLVENELNCCPEQEN
jgi:D-sedoheptulose 7-phosphate isomerase